MEIQSSLEFIVILAAVAALSVFILSMYAGFSHQEKSIFAMLPYVSTYNGAYSGNGISQLQAFLYVPNVTYVNKSNSVYLMLYLPQNTSIASATPVSAGALFLPSGYRNPAAQGSYLLGFAFVPNSLGVQNVSVDIILRGSNGTYARTLSSSTITVPSPTSVPRQNPAAAYAKVNGSNESVIYRLSGFHNIQQITESSSCTQEDFWYVPVPISQQCGDAKWQIRVFSTYCYDAYATPMTICFYLRNTTANVSTVNNTYGLSYNVLLTLDINGSQMHATLNGQNQSPVYLGDSYVGNAMVHSAASTSLPIPQFGIVVIGKGGEIYPTNYSLYQTHQQYLNSVEGVLGYYNNSNVDSPTISAVQQAVSTYNTDVGTLLNASPTQLQCNVSASGLSFRAATPFAYNIFANLSVSAYSGNMTLYSGSSSVVVR